MNDERNPPIDGEAGDVASEGQEATASEPVGNQAAMSNLLTPGQPSSATSKILVVLFGTVLVIGGIYVSSPDNVSDNLSLERKGFDDEDNRKHLLGYKTPFIAEGINDPEIRPVSKTRFAAATPVIGVALEGKYRAYPLVTLLASFTREGSSGAVINDKLGGKLITVTSDSDVGLVRVFRLAEGSSRKKIGLWLIGRGDGGGMLLGFDTESDFRQDAKEIPDLEIQPFVEQTLSEWRTSHPETDVYVGEFPTPDLQMEATLQHMTPEERDVADPLLAERDRKNKILSPKKKKRQDDAAKSSPPGDAPVKPSSGLRESDKKVKSQ